MAKIKPGAEFVYPDEGGDPRIPFPKQSKKRRSSGDPAVIGRISICIGLGYGLGFRRREFIKERHKEKKKENTLLTKQTKKKKKENNISTKKKGSLKIFIFSFINPHL